jgi:glyoxylase-like metal-dependent hydrolase (beta-lactamase superfamily II)
MPPLPVADAWWTATSLADGITLVTEPHVHAFFRANVFHVRGRDADLVIDAGMGLAPLRPLIRQLAGPAQPLVAVATHTHVDHVGCLHEFAERLVHPAEASELEHPSSVSLFADDFSFVAALRAAGESFPDLLIDALPSPGYDPRSYRMTPAPATRLVEEGDTVSLGDRTFTVLHTPGHSPGGISLYEPTTGILLAGDAIYDGRLLDDLPGSDVAAYVATLTRLRRLGGVRVVHAGHDGSFDAARLRELCDAYLAAKTPG